MKKKFIQLSIETSHSLRDVLVALLGEIGYEGFLETENGLDAYISSEDYDESALKDMIGFLDNPEIRYSASLLPDTNWNNKWEENYPSVFVDNFCQIIPSFRSPEEDFKHTLIIDPKMSFGTGNHETTRLMISQMERLDFHGNQVLDMGCGTAVLAILARKMGAKQITAIDIDPWSFENASENLSLNKVDNIHVVLGDASHIPDTKYDVILANINRNILLSDMHEYVQHLSEGGVLLISGFYEQDKSVIDRLASSLNLSARRQTIDNKWMAISYHYTNQ